MADVPPVVVLAGGLGTRVSHLLGDSPKPMAEVAGRPFLEWICLFWAGQGARRIMLSIGYRGEVVAAHFAHIRLSGVQITCHLETDRLGTAGGFLNACRTSGENPHGWLVCNGDSLAVTPIAPFLAAVSARGFAAGVLGIDVCDTSRFGTLEMAPDGRLQRFAEKRPGRGTINAGVYYIRADLPGRFAEARPLSFETEVFPALLRGGDSIYAHSVDAPFIDIGTPETLPMANQFILANHTYFPT